MGWESPTDEGCCIRGLRMVIDSIFSCNARYVLGVDN
jgi:hypothetical protein